MASIDSKHRPLANRCNCGSRVDEAIVSEPVVARSTTSRAANENFKAVPDSLEPGIQR